MAASGKPRALPAEVRRAPYIFFIVQDVEVLELGALFQGQLQLGYEGVIELIGPFSGARRRTSLREIEFLTGISATSPSMTQELLEREGEDEEEHLLQLIEEGHLVTSQDTRWKTRASIPWSPVASLFHVSCLHEPEPDGAHLDIEEKLRNAESNYRTFVEEHGPPPPPRLRFRRSGLDQPEANHSNIELPQATHQNDSFYQALLDRRTCRHFSDQPLGLEKLSRLLRWSFGVQATAALGSDYVAPLKTSASGGSMHPIEAFPVVRSVEGLDPGVYHYDAYAHTLTPLKTAPEAVVRELIVRLTCGQEYAGSVGAAVLLVARLGRNFWKYPKRARTFGVLHQDAGHLSQTFYLVSARLGLGAFYTAAISGRVTRDVLGLDDSVDAPMGLCGCGNPAPQASSWLTTRVYAPSDTKTLFEEEVRSPGNDQVSLEIDSESLVDDKSREFLPSDLYFRGLRISPSLDED